MTSKRTLTLPVSIYSTDQLRVCSEELGSYAGRVRKAAQTKTAPAEDLSVSMDTQALLEQLPATERDNVDSIRELAEALNEALTSYPQVTITLPALASRTLREELVSWFRTEIRPNVLVSFHVNPDIAGGMIVRTTNRVHDFSFRGRLLESAPKFAGILEHV